MKSDNDSLNLGDLFYIHRHSRTKLYGVFLGLKNQGSISLEKIVFIR